MVKWRRSNYRRIDFIRPQIGCILNDSRHPVSMGKFSATLGVAIHQRNELNSLVPCQYRQMQISRGFAATY
jgi:hypothetical protein